ncbi:hypothetical protein TRAPUB_13834 [Trametes pubescens]|uniref:Uncharacterized protein n=1 Tax=Trametes pubescens TaxID=154538 RepID=A0A1M2VQ03_TRAPU|nr:hypothetical protein TRAPUB_13834 [Trametes pubescens]
MEHERDNRTPEFDYAAALEEHHANAAALKAHCEQYPNAWFSQPTVYYPMPPSLDQVPEETTDASRSLSVAPETSSDVEMADAASDCEFIALTENDVGGIALNRASRASSFRNYDPVPPNTSVGVFDPTAASRVYSHSPLSVSTTTSGFILDVLALRISLVTHLHAGHNHTDLTIPEETLRALLAKALVWFIDRECLEDVGESRIVLVGREAGEPMTPVSPAIFVDELRIIAQYLPEGFTTQQATDDFDAYMFHAGQYSAKSSACFVVFSLFLNAILWAARAMIFLVASLFRAIM